ncbi:DUF2341 domain-containing protein [bacterium]|nr:DUF2341 domain-containing protein [bacterium]
MSSTGTASGLIGVLYIPVRVIKKGHEVIVHNTHEGLVRHLEWYRNWHEQPRHRVVHYSALVVSVAVMAVLSLGFGRVAQAFDNWLQSDWSGGVGTNHSNQFAEADNIVTSTPNQLTVGATTISDWCNIPSSCDSDWQYRQQININSDQARTDYPVKFTVPYNGNMKSDFADLRFTLTDGTLLSMWHENTQNATSDEVFVKIPTLAQGVTKIYMYYGNSAAGSSWDQDVFSFYDDFNGNSIDLGKWNVSASLDPAISVSDGVLHFDNSAGNSAGNGGLTPITDQIDRNDPKRFEFSVNVMSLGNQSNGTCTSFQPNMYNVIDWGNAVDQHSAYFGCEAGNDSNYYGAFYDYLNGQPYSINPADMQGLQEGQTNWWRRYAIEPTATGAKYHASNNWVNWDTYTAPNTPTMSRSPLAPTIYVGTAYTNTNFNLDTVRIYKTGASTNVLFGLEQSQGGAIGSLSSATFQAGTKPYFGTLTLGQSGGGVVGVRIRTAQNSDMSDAQGFDSCNIINSGAAISTSSCVEPNEPYVQYQILMSQPAGGDIAVQSVDIEYLDDPDAPDTPANIVVKKSPSGTAIADGGWINTQNPYISWDAASDNLGGSGVAGYCVYIGDNNTDDPATTKGIITDPSPLNTGGACQYATANTNLDLASVGHGSMNNGSTYYITLRSIDYAGNVSTGSVQRSWKLDTVAPDVQTLFNAPPAATNSAVFSATWLTLGNVIEADSGFAGFKYCVTNANLGFSGCTQNDNNWYGKNHTSGRIDDVSDVFTFAEGIASTSEADADRLDLGGPFSVGVNFVYYVGVDNAGNLWNANNGSNAVVLITQHPAGAPTNLTVSPTSNSANSFSFSWDQPGFFVGAPSNINYCWSVNEPIAQDGSNCKWTGKGITQLAAGPYATLQGTNIMYISGKDDTGNFDGTQAATVEFEASTVAPGAPTNLDVADASIKATSTWRLAMSWDAPVSVGAGISSYKIYRSTDNSTFTQVGSTSASNLSFIDSGLNQVTYYYKVLACDNADACGVASNISSKKPTGKYTTPPNLTSDANQPRAENITARKASIVWFTDRESDSRVAIGTTSGQYATEEIGNSDQVTSHRVNLDNLNPGTKYYYVTKWTDTDGNTGVSPEVSFTTLPAPTVKEAAATNINVDRATINFTVSSASAVKIYYGRTDTFGGIKTLNTSTRESSYAVELPELTDGTKYLFRIDGADSDGNQYFGNIYSFTTLPLPKIQNLRFDTVEGEPSSTQRVTWETNVPSSSEVSYGPVGATPKDLINSSLTTKHELIIRNLEDDTEYSLVARSRDASGNLATSSQQVFRTALDTRPAKISDFNVEVGVRGTGASARGQVVVSWKTDEPTSSAVGYGIGTDVSAATSQTAEDGRLTKDHVVVLSDLSPSSVYQVRAISYDKARNKAMSESQSAIVGRASDSILSIIFNALSRIFGFGG